MGMGIRRGTKSTVYVALACLFATPVAAQEVQRLAGQDVAVYTLAGRVRVVSGSGAEVVVRITRGGGGCVTAPRRNRPDRRTLDVARDLSG
jgi:hypothetical protein